MLAKILIIIAILYTIWCIAHLVSHKLRNYSEKLFLLISPIVIGFLSSLNYQNLVLIIQNWFEPNKGISTGSIIDCYGFLISTIVTVLIWWNIEKERFSKNFNLKCKK